MLVDTTTPDIAVKILLVEDNGCDALLLRRLFKSIAPDAYEVTHRNCMADAVLHAATQIIDIVLLDLGLPDANGLEAVRLMLAAAPRTPVALTMSNSRPRRCGQARRISW
jgi:CheY-like chemotaxis protein